MKKLATSIYCETLECLAFSDYVNILVALYGGCYDDYVPYVLDALQEIKKNGIILMAK